jgi:hypothetical protein
MRHLALLALCACHPTEPADPGDTTASPPGSPSGDPPTETSLPTGPALPPGDPGAGDVAVTVDSTAERHPISPWIYGDNGADFDTWGANLTLTRAGGNRFTAYNWENNASNAGTDWYNQNDGFLGGGDIPGEAIRPGIQAARDHGAGTIVTVPIQGFVAADKDEDGDVGQTPDYLDVRFHPSFPTKGSAFEYPPDGGDHAVYQDEFAAWLLDEFPGSDPPLLFDLDNEPDLWSETHPRIHPDPVRYDELVDDTIAYAAAIKAVDPASTVLGPVSYGWNGYTTLQNAPDGNGRDFVEFYLDALAAADADQGRLVDAIDLHWYPEALGGGTRITDDGAGAALAAARLQAPRSLWDDTYTEDSWITQWSTYGPIALIPRMQDKIAAFYPDTALSFSEYYYGGGDDVSGGLAEADVLGIFAHFGVFAATLWHTGSTEDRFIHGAYDLFRDYDGAGGRFGSTSVASSTSDVAATSAWASAEGEGVRVLLVNKTDGPLTAAVQVAHPVVLATATPYVLDAAGPTPRAEAAIPLPVQNALLYDMPPLSATMLVFAP